MVASVESSPLGCQASYYDHALYLAEKHCHNDWYLKIQLEDNKNYQKALDYIGKLEFAAVSLQPFLAIFISLLISDFGAIINGNFFLYSVSQRKCHCNKISNKITFVRNTVKIIDETRSWQCCLAYSKYRLLSCNLTE